MALARNIHFVEWVVLMCDGSWRREGYVFCFGTPPPSNAAFTVCGVLFITHFVLLLQSWFGPMELEEGCKLSAQIPDCGTGGLGARVRLSSHNASAFQRSHHCVWRTLRHTLHPHLQRPQPSIACSGSKAVTDHDGVKYHCCSRLSRARTHTLVSTEQAVLILLYSFCLGRFVTQISQRLKWLVSAGNLLPLIDCNVEQRQIALR